MAHIGNIKDRIELTVTLIGDYEFVSYYGYIENLNHIYTLKDEDGNMFVWKTSNTLGMDTMDDNGDEIWYGVRKGDKIQIKATVKDHSEYKGTPQTVLTRVKVTEILERALTYEQKQELKRQDQIASIQEGDQILNMSYRNYKEHYGDCETVAGSYCDETRTIDVIVRDGRLKPNGVRGRRFSDYLFKHPSGRCRCIYAVCEENAWRRLEKEFDNTEDWYLANVTPSGSSSRWF